MFDANLTIGSETYNSTGSDLIKTIRARTGDPTGIDQTVTISHGVAKVDGLNNDRRLVRVDYRTSDSLGKTTSASVYAVINQPRSAAVTNAVMTSMITTLASFLTGSGIGGLNSAKLLNGEH